MPRAILWVGAILLAAGCQTTPDYHHEAQTPAVVSSTRSLSSMVRVGWALPMRVRGFFSNSMRGEPLDAVQTRREEAAIRTQIEAVREAYRRSAFDLFSVDVVVGDVEEPLVRVDGETLALRVFVPRPASDGAPRVAPARAILATWAEAYDWHRDGRWYASEPDAELMRALRRDLKKLQTLERDLDLHCHRLAMLRATLERRAEVAEGSVDLTPSESDYARAAQFSATFALHRVLNTLARWRLAAEDADCPVRGEALVALAYGRHLHTGYLGWLLDTIVGGRTTTKLWTREFWHRNPLYTVLDSEANLVILSEATGSMGTHAGSGQIPAGSIRALLKLRGSSRLNGWFEEIDEAWAAAPRAFPKSALRNDLAPVLTRLPAAIQLSADHVTSGFTAWKELWDARIKNTFSYPGYVAIAEIARFLGDTRVSHPDPAVSPEQLAALEARLRPGDIILVRQDLYLSNAFLPGFWPHAILYLGPESAWTSLKLPGGTTLGDDPVVREVLTAFRPDISGDPARVIEAISEGVVFNSMRLAVQKDFVIALRPELSEGEIAAGIRRALALHMRPYDFSFDFASDDKIVCTELVYRAYNEALNFRVGIDGDSAQRDVPGVLTVMGRETMPANELARYALYMQDHPDASADYPGPRLSLIALYDKPDGDDGDARAVEYVGDEGLDALRDSVDR